MAAPTIAAWRAAGTMVRWREHAIFARVDGPRTAPPLLLIHGFPTSSWDWWPLWDALAATHRVIACDLLGLGLSAKPRGGYSVMVQADLVEAVAAWAGVTRAAVLAHDYGDTVAQELLARQRSGGALRLAGVAFLNGGLFPEAHRARPIQRLLASPLAKACLSKVCASCSSASVAPGLAASKRPRRALARGEVCAAAR